LAIIESRERSATPPDRRELFQEQSFLALSTNATQPLLKRFPGGNRDGLAGALSEISRQTLGFGVVNAQGHGHRLLGVPIGIFSTASREGRILINDGGDFGEPALHQRLGVHGIVLPELDRLSNQRTSIRLPRSSSSSRRRPGSISAIDTGFRRYDEFFALRVDDKNFSTNTLVAVVISINAGCPGICF
jgi:hypothetical protein